jgi:glycosyltransferase involved in cell wall biosynthesis
VFEGTVRPLVAIETHPIQYHAPVYRTIQAKFGIPVAVIYGSDFSVAGYTDREFGASFAWDTDLLSGYEPVFLSRAPKQASSRGMGKALKRLEPGAVLLVGYSPAFHQAAFFAAWRSGAPILCRGETTDHARHRGAVQEYLRTKALRFLYKRCARLLHVGRRSYQHFTRLGVPPTKLVFSPYCVNTAVFRTGEPARHNLRADTRGRLQIHSDQIVLLFSGKLSARKGPDILLLGVKSLPPEIRARIVVMFLGSGAMQPALEAVAKQTPEIEVRFLGFQNQRQLSPYYHSADLLVLPSRHSETWGLVVNEALHHGLPCVVSDAVGCAPDLIDSGRTGEPFEAGSADSLSAALLRSLGLTGRSDIRNFCRDKVGGYTVEKAAEGIAESYWDVVSMQKGVVDQCQSQG